MDNISAVLAGVFSWVARASTFGIVTIIIISLVQLVGRRLLPARWTYTLWLILLARLALPFGPECIVSLWNVLPRINYGGGMAESGAKGNGPSRDMPHDPSFMAEYGRTSLPPSKDSVAHDHLQDKSNAQSILQMIWHVIPVVWLAGALILVTIIAFNNLRLWRSVRKLRLVTDQQSLDLFEDCKQLVQVRTVVGLAITGQVKSPSLFGFVRPRVLLPADLASRIPLEELRYIFLHELAHFRRGDIWIGWIVAFVQSLHWFNPFVWWAFYRMRADREIACDALALSYMRGEESGRYGGALINLLERFGHSQQLPVVAGILENKAQLKRRMTMITQFKRPTRREGVLAGALLTILSMALLTDAKDDSFQSQEQSANNPSTMQPIRVGGGVQQSKLIYKADPMYPDNARAVGLSGKVVLMATTDEKGMVSDVRVVEGHPVLGDAAATAVKRWRYSPTFLNGEPVPITTKVTIAFSTEGTVDTEFREEPSSTKGREILPILVPPDLSDQQAIARIHLLAEPLVPYAGRQYYTVVPDISAPVLTINKQRLRELANASWPADGMQSRAPMFFYLFINEDGGISGIWQMQGPKIPEIDRELEKAQVMAPARFGAQAVPAWVAVEIDIPKSMHLFSK